MVDTLRCFFFFFLTNIWVTRAWNLYIWHGLEEVVSWGRILAFLLKEISILQAPPLASPQANSHLSRLNNLPVRHHIKTGMLNVVDMERRECLKEVLTETRRQLDSPGDPTPARHQILLSDARFFLEPVTHDPGISVLWDGNNASNGLSSFLRGWERRSQGAHHFQRGKR